MSSTLVIVRPFGAHVKGDVVADAATIALILASENAGCAVRVVAPAAAPAPTTTPAAAKGS